MDKPIAAVLIALVAAACALPSGTRGDPNAAGATLTVLAAASLRLPVEEAARRFEASHPGLIVRLSFASSTALRVQIEQGAPADVFLSADTANPDAIAAGGFGDGAPIVVARNSLAIVVPLANPALIDSPQDLARPGLTLIAAGDGVPITSYARQLFDNLEREPGYPDGYSAAVLANVVSGEDDVRAVLAKVELGEGDAGVVYATDARVSSRVRSIPIPVSANVVASYAGIVLEASRRPREAAAFLAWLVAPEGRVMLTEFGFETGP